jgi:hypothetical protein
MAISEKTLKDMYQNRLDDRNVFDKDRFIKEDKESTSLYDIYLISTETFEEALNEAKIKGIPKIKIVHVPWKQPIRADRLLGLHNLHKDQLIGFFSDMEIQYLTS